MCKHLTELLTARVEPVKPSRQGCQECLETGDPWVHLRLCMACGHVGCCDSSPNKHATRHSHATGHPVVKSFEPDENWAWCYRDGEMVEAIPAFPEESPRQHYASPGEPWDAR
jgi:uncharacterized UBP type Zn finger protein